MVSTLRAVRRPSLPLRAPFLQERWAFYWLFMTHRVSVGTMVDYSTHESESERRFGFVPGEASVTLETEEKGE